MVTPAEPVLKTKMEDMGSLKMPSQKSDSPQKKKHLIEIIVQSVAKEAPGSDPNKTIEVIGKLTQQGARLLQMGNTVLMMQPTGPAEVSVHTFTVDSLPIAVKQWRTFLTKTAPQMGIKKVKSTSNSPAITRLVQQVGVPVQINQTPQGFTYEWNL